MLKSHFCKPSGNPKEAKKTYGTVGGIVKVGKCATDAKKNNQGRQDERMISLLSPQAPPPLSVRRAVSRSIIVPEFAEVSSWYTEKK